MAGEDALERDPSCSVEGTAHWRSHCGKCGDSPKNKNYYVTQQFPSWVCVRRKYYFEKTRAPVGPSHTSFSGSQDKEVSQASTDG